LLLLLLPSEESEAAAKPDAAAVDAVAVAVAISISDDAELIDPGEKESERLVPATGAGTYGRGEATSILDTRLVAGENGSSFLPLAAACEPDEVFLSRRVEIPWESPYRALATVPLRGQDILGCVDRNLPITCGCQLAQNMNDIECRPCVVP
jgi:hypothetical protein